MQHEHDPSKRDHRAENARSNPGYPLPGAEVKLLVPLLRRRTGIDHELRVGDNHLECGDTLTSRAREQVFDVVVRAPESEKCVRRVQRLV